MPDNKTGPFLQGITRLLTDGTLGTTDIVESMHHRIVHPPLLPSTPIQHLITGIAGITYRNIKWSTRLIGKGIDKSLYKLAPFLGEIKDTPKKVALVSILNGILGDYLEINNNPLAIQMNLKNQDRDTSIDASSQACELRNVKGRILIMVHGSCGNDFQWNQEDHNHGIALAEKFDKTALFLNYNSGCHVSSNGKDLNKLLERLIYIWPVPVEEITIISHSMGGLVTRSAYHYGRLNDNGWIKHCSKMVFLGTPHHGAPLERIGNYLDTILHVIPYTTPISKLGKIRSAGITDLRYGHVVEEDWKDRDRFELSGDQRNIVPLPDGVECFAIAGITGKTSDKPSIRKSGDKMVSLNSALGIHKDPEKSLEFKKKNTWISEETTHSELLSNKYVFNKLASWMK
ncbi:MAG: alpha/beta hydrolase [Saprospiraceae bacterium]|nr:alpha/beta hydrolase [Saprospiraceae bacterium]